MFTMHKHKGKQKKWKKLIWKPHSTASNSNKSTPTCSPVLRKRSRSPTPQSQEGETMVEKGSDHSSDKSPSTPEQVVQRTYSLQSARSGGKNSKSHKRLSKYDRLNLIKENFSFPFGNLSNGSMWNAFREFYMEPPWTGLEDSVENPDICPWFHLDSTPGV
ncbi:hypothetical protein fugu_010981 [Takifugu bimaculatus]|uniref:Uncharacterized protein n=1 Tax=Takifugu bimaculatus TaxID=433685 RepID=A0A4Z2CBN8_9TELE|nr:hypothetical protein fugu_010981 [Takifugu bimaculatus]